MTISRFVTILCLIVPSAHAQVLEKLTVEKIMRHPKWIGVAPSSPHWSPDSKTLYFYWNPESADSDSLYAYNVATKAIRKTTASERTTGAPRFVQYNNSFTKGVYEKNGDIFLYDIASGKTSQVSNTSGNEFGPQFSGDEKAIIFSAGTNLYHWSMSSGMFSQLTDFRAGQEANHQHK